MNRAFLSLQLLFISGMALASGYPWPDLREASWDTALFLTPYGILSNLVDPAKVALKSFYFDISPGQQTLSIEATIGMIAIYLLMLTNVIWFIAKRPKP
jgi:hypothetical protein